MTSDYKYSIAQCDVIDKRSLESYRNKRRDWLSWIETDEHHAIWKVLHSMVWTDVSFRTLAHFAAGNDDSALHNPLLIDALYDGHIATQVLSIRRLMDNKGKGVISLRGLVNDIIANENLLTRENYVCFDGLPFDYVAVQSKEMLARAGEPFWSEPNPHGMSQLAHEEFDKLMDVAPGQRRREDRIPPSILKTLDRWLNNSGAEELRNWSHTYLAHASAPDRRKGICASQATTYRITKTIQALTRVMQAISAHILFGGERGLMPVAGFDQFEKLDKAIMRPGGEAEAFEFWKKLSDERDSYPDGVLADLIEGGTTIDRQRIR